MKKLFLRVFTISILLVLLDKILNFIFINHFVTLFF